MRDCKGQFIKGMIPPNKVWTDEYIKLRLTDFVINFYKDKGFILPSTQIKNFDSKLFSVFRKNIEKPNEYYLKLITELNLPKPSNSYYKDNHIFRGFYELVGYCFIKSWNIPFEPFKELNFNGKLYVSDGFFPEIHTYWEHWGELNPNNKLKKQYYKSGKYSLIQTIDSDCQKTNKGIKFLYESLRESLLPYYPNIPKYVSEERLKLISASVPDFNQIMSFISNVLIENNQTISIDERKLRETKDGYKVISLINKLFDGRVSLVKEELNKIGFGYKIKADRGSYNDISYFIKEITPYIKKYNKVLTQSQFCKLGRNDITIMAARYFGGIEQLRRNGIEEGSLFYITKSILGDKAPYDKKLDWGYKTEENIKKILSYYKINKLPLPKNLNDLRVNKIYQPFGKALHTQISRIGGWEKFKTKYYE